MRPVLRPILLATAFGLIALTAGCEKPAVTPASAKPAVVDTAQIEQALRADEVQWNADYKAKDLAKIAAHYAPQGVLMTAGAPVMSGTDALGMGMKELVADPAFHLELNTEKVGVAAGGDLAYTRGAYTLTVTDPQTK
ncbi:MAG TPA: nuclear transport factor 2 family protein, partial [Phenylobacterium sp.]